MSNKDKLQIESLEDKVKDYEALNKALMTLAGEVSCVMEEMVKEGKAEDIFASLGEASGRRLGKRAREQFGRIENVEEALDTFIHRTNMWYGYEIEIDRIEDGTIYFSVLKCFIRDVLKHRGLTTESPLCSITRGYLKGALNELTGKDVDVELVYGDVNGVCRKKITAR